MVNAWLTSAKGEDAVKDSALRAAGELCDDGFAATQAFGHRRAARSNASKANAATADAHGAWHGAYSCGFRRGGTIFSFLKNLTGVMCYHLFCLTQIANKN